MRASSLSARAQAPDHRVSAGGGRYPFGVATRTWPEPVERVIAYLREAGAEVRVEEFAEGTPTADARRPRHRVRPRADRQVARLRLRRAPGGRARSRGPARRLREDRAGRRKPVRPDRRHRGGAGCDRLRAGRSGAVPAPRVSSVFIERTLLAQPVLWIGAGSEQPHGGSLADRAATPFPGTSDGRRRRGHLTSAEEGGSLNARDREDLDERGARRLERRANPRGRTRAALRLRRLRGHPRLRDSRRAARSSGSATTSSASTTRRGSYTWSCRSRSRSCGTRLPRADRRERPARVLPAPDRLLRLRRARRLGGRQPRRRRDHELAVGRLPRRGRPEERDQREDLELAADRART